MGVVREVPIKSAVISNYEGMDALVGEDGRVYLGRRENYHSGIGEDTRAWYDNWDGSLQLISDNVKMFHFLYGDGWVLSQRQMRREHWFIDLGLAGPKIDFIRPAFPYSGICQEFRNRMAAYGFVERYPAGKESVTGIAHEPWHFRYVGCPHAEIMQSKGFVLEEYHEYLKEFPFGGTPLHWKSGDMSYSIFYMTAQMAETVTLELEDGTTYDLSGDNEAGVIVTLRRCIS